MPLSDRPGRFASLKRAYVPGPAGEAREVTVRSCWPHKGRFVLKLDGVDSIDAAEAFRGQELRIGEEELASLFARCLAVYYAPVDEDFGMVPYEAFMAQKPVVTTRDAGAPLDVVRDRVTGLVTEPRAEALAVAFRFLLDHEPEAVRGHLVT